MKTFAEYQGLNYKLSEEISININKMTKNDNYYNYHFTRYLQDIYFKIIDCNNSKNNHNSIVNYFNNQEKYNSPKKNLILDKIINEISDNSLINIEVLTSNKYWQYFLETHNNNIIFGYGCMHNKIISDVYLLNLNNIHNINKVFNYYSLDNNFPLKRFMPSYFKPEGRRGMATVKLENKIYFYGGYKDRQNPYFNDMWKFDCQTFHWNLVKKDFGIGARSNSKMTKIGQYIYVFGGFDQTSSTYPDYITVYDTYSESTCNISIDIPSRENHVFNYFNDKLWIGFGFNGKPCNDLNFVKVSNFHELSNSMNYNSPLNNSASRSILSSPKGSFLSPRIEEELQSSKKNLNTLTEASFQFDVVRVKLDPSINADRAMDCIITDGKMIIFGGKDYNMYMEINILCTFVRDT
eukprot:Mrub_04391.p1 GENE.Mrub_04391~~Mrub_04391.p1  ORF type:complete len:408 (+),score=32.84 Mrub_04391:2-1225(+)